MANDITSSPDRHVARPAATPTLLPEAAAVYAANASVICEVVSWFRPHSSLAADIQEIAQELSSEVPASGYSRYVNLICFRVVRAHLLKHGKPQIDLDVDHAFCLFLRERLGFSCGEIAAIAGTSEGSVRTRLERARARAFARPLSGASPPSSSHSCIRSRETIEDWNLTGTRLGEHPTPSGLTRATDGCSKCDQVLHQRLASIAYFRDLPQVDPPESLRQFPVTPLFAKEGRRLMFNWAAAPWYVKAMFEGLLATTLVLGIVLSIPRIKNLYEFWLERRLDLYSVAELAAGLGSQHEAGSVEERPSDAARTSAAIKEAVVQQQTAGFVGPMPQPSPTAEPLSPVVKLESEFIGRDSLAISSDRIYRILIKTDSPEAIKEQAFKLLNAINYVPYDKDSAGAELPGGVMFDVFVPIKSYKQLEAELVRLGESKVMYTRAKERGMAGKARVKIWLQRI